MDNFDFSLFDRLSQAKILIVGDVMLDRYWHGETSRISPEAPVPVVKISRDENRVGGAANVARNVAHLDGNVGLLGIAGDDEYADLLESLMEHERIRSHIIRIDTEETITKLRVISQHQQVVRLDREKRFSEQAANALEAKFKSVVSAYDCVIFSDYDKGALQSIKNMIAIAKSEKKWVFVDPKKRDLSEYAGADYITPNLKEFIQAGGNVDTEALIEQSAQAFLGECNIENMLLTRSEKGMSLISATQKNDFPAQVLEVNDVTGAGDTVIACLSLFISLGAKPAHAAEIANVAAGIVVGKLGAACVSPEELMLKMNRQQFKSASLSHYQFVDAVRHIDFAKASGEKIVFTNGCFDILHAGHVKYLEEARALGDRLVVGLNTDESVKRLKGESRPVNTLEDRMRVLNALASVDWVIPFGAESDDTPLELIKKVQPHVLVKGGDYTIDTIVGADFVTAGGGQVEVIPFLDGRSTSNIIRAIKND